jgi:hypothetical protein
MRGVCRKIVLAVEVVSIAIGLTMALTAGQAKAMGPMTAGLSIHQLPSEACGNLVCAAGLVLTMNATVPLSPGEAPDLSKHRILVRLWGDDPTYDDLQLPSQYINYGKPTAIEPRCGRFGGSYFYAEPTALKIRWCRWAPTPDGNTSLLDEDTAFFDDRDEIYVGVRLISPDTGTVRSDETNRIRGYW